MTQSIFDGQIRTFARNAANDFMKLYNFQKNYQKLKYKFKIHFVRKNTLN